MTLLTLDELAAFLRLSPSHTRCRVVCQPGFPAPVRLPSAGGRGSPRWVQGEVERWVADQREVA